MSTDASKEPNVEELTKRIKELESVNLRLTGGCPAPLTAPLAPPKRSRATRSGGVALCRPALKFSAAHSASVLHHDTGYTVLQPCPGGCGPALQRKKALSHASGECCRASAA
jgi:hypothetical protein